MTTLPKSRFFHLLSWLCAAWLMAACWGAQAEPAASPTVVATATATPMPAQPTATPPPAVILAPSPTPTAVAESVIASNVTATQVISPTSAPSSTVAVAAPSEANEGCPQEVDLDLAGYPNIQEKMGCALQPANFDPVAINEFGPGPNFDRFMLWFGNENKIYVLLPDKRWQAYDDTWQEGQPTFTCNPTKDEPKSPPLPRRGFNKIWCTVPKLQETMGTIVVEERQCQHSVVQQFQQGRLLGCYEDATIRYIRLLDNGTWDTLLTR